MYKTYNRSMSHFVSINYPAPPLHFQQHLRTASNLTHNKVKILTTDHNKDKAKKHNSKATSKNPNHQPSHTNNNKILTTNQHTDNNKKILTTNQHTDNNKISNSITKYKTQTAKHNATPYITKCDIATLKRFIITYTIILIIIIIRIMFSFLVNTHSLYYQHIYRCHLHLCI